MVQEVIDLLSLVEDQEDLDVIAYHVQKKQAAIRRRNALLKELKS